MEIISYIRLLSFLFFCFCAYLLNDIWSSICSNLRNNGDIKGCSSFFFWLSFAFVSLIVVFIVSIEITYYRYLRYTRKRS